MKRCFFAALFLAISGVLAACGGGGGSTIPAPVASLPAKTGNTKATITIKLTVPGSAPAGATAQLRRRFTQLASTNGIIFTIYAHGGSPSTPIVQTAADISATSPASVCTTNTLASRVCTVSFAAPAGSANDLLVQTIDQTPAGGVVPATYNALAAAVITNVNVVAGQPNSFSLTLNPIVASMALQTVPNVIHSLLPVNFGVNANALDADGNLVVGSYVDQFGNPVTVNLGFSSDPNTSLSLNTSALNASGTLVTGTYNAGADITANTTTPITLTASIGGSATLTLVAPQVVSYAEPNLQVTPGPPGYDGSAYVSTYPGSPHVLFPTTQACCGGVDAFDPIAQSLVQAPEPAGSPNVQGGLTVTGSTMYYGTTSTALGQVFYSPSLTAPTGIACTQAPQCYGDSNLAYDSADNELFFQGGGATGLSEYAVGSDGFVSSIAPCTTGPCTITGVTWDPNTDTVWFIDGGVGGAIYNVAASGTGLVSTSGQSVPYFDIDIDYNSVVYVTNPGAKTISMISSVLPGGCCSPVVPVKLGAPRYINFSRYEGTATAVWFTEDTSSGIAIGRYDIATHDVGESALGAAGGFSGSLQVDQLHGEVVMLHFSGLKSAGEVLTVTP